MARTSRRSILIATLLALVAAAPAPAQTTRPARPANVVVILADDLGYGELGCYGNDFNETPHIDALAGGGTRFTAAYANPVCSPSRAALLTGQYPARFGMDDFLRDGADKHLPDDLVTLPGALKRAGYATGHVGKWHLTGYESAGAKVESPPTAHGFGEQRLVETSNISWGDYFYPYDFMPAVTQRLGVDEYLTDRVNLEAVDFLERHAAEPLFLYKSHYAVHSVVRGRPDLLIKYLQKGMSRGLYGEELMNRVNMAAQVELIDDGVGQIVDTLKKQGRLDSTLIVFTSDNGGESTTPGNPAKPGVGVNAPLRGGKSMVYEGGVRVPMVASMPGTVPAGVTRDEPVHFVDLMPTVLDLCGVAPPADQVCDGRSLAPLLRSGDATLPPRELFWHYPLDKPHGLGGRSAGAIRSGDWKLIEDYTSGKVELYNLADDLGEQRDLADADPQKRDELLEKLKAWRESIGVKPQQMTKK